MLRKHLEIYKTIYKQLYCNRIAAAYAVLSVVVERVSYIKIFWSSLDSLSFIWYSIHGYICIQRSSGQGNIFGSSFLQRTQVRRFQSVCPAWPLCWPNTGSRFPVSALKSCVPLSWEALNQPCLSAYGFSILSVGPPEPYWDLAADCNPIQPGRFYLHWRGSEKGSLWRAQVMVTYKENR